MMYVRSITLVFFLLLTQLLTAQICTGSLGDPIVNITFGAGTNPGPPLSSATTNYQYVANDCPGDGFYALRNASNACFGDTWHTITDHTGNANGYFMLINASIQPSAFYLDTVRGLCGNTTYEFASWVLNILKSSSCGGAGITPDLTFRMERIDGTLLQSYNTNSIPNTSAPQWKQYGFFFTTPNNVTDVVLRIFNNSQGGCGNDIALDDITFRPCGPQITPSITGTTATSVSHCEGIAKTYTFNATLSVGFNNPQMQWQQSINNGVWTDIPGANNASYSKFFSASLISGTYSFRLVAAESGNFSSPQCRTASTPLIVLITANPSASAGNNGPVCEGMPLTLTSTGPAPSWTGPNGFVASTNNPIISNTMPINSGKYYVSIDNAGCLRNDSTLVVVNAKPVVSVAPSLIDMCKGDSAIVNVSGATSYQWVPSKNIILSSSGTILFPSDSIIYSVIGSFASGCSDTAVVAVNVIRRPNADAGFDKSVIEGTSTQLFGSATGDSIRYYWLPSAGINDVYTLQPFVNPLTDTSYILYVESLKGCGIITDTVNVHVFKKLVIPNAFSPNKDGINDVWELPGLESYPNAAVSIYDRYGQLIFYSTRFKNWNGTSKGATLPIGIYYYLINVHHNLSLISGWLMLLR